MLIAAFNSRPNNRQRKHMDYGPVGHIARTNCRGYIVKLEGSRVGDNEW